MRRSRILALIAGGALSAAALAPMAVAGAEAAATPATATSDDPYLWLEQVDGTRAMGWVRAENARTEAVLDKDPRYAVLYREALAIAQAKDRIPRPSLIGGRVYNFWQDAQHAHGLWRRTTLAAYRRPQVKWQPVLDLDALSKTEKGNWFWSGAQCAEPAERLCMIALSDGGEDAVTEREFDLRSGQFVADGFALPKGKQSVAWQDPATLLVSREWAPGELTKSGYAYIVKRVARGQPLAAAQEIYRGTPDDVGVDPIALHDGESHQALLVLRNVTFFESEYRIVGEHGLARLAMPQKAAIVGMVSGRIIIELREDWKTADGRTLPQGSLVSVELEAARATPERLEPTLIYAPTPRRAFAEAATTRDRLLVVELDNVKGRAYAYTPEPQGRWSRRALALPDNATIEIADTDLHSNRAFFDVTGFLTPSSLWFTDFGGDELTVVKTLPPKFNATGLTVEQFEASSRDGTKIPYFIVHSKAIKLDGSTPTILTAYGGFQVSETPYYSAATGKLWLERGGAFALANIRGGGEFGPAWHEAGLKTRRQRIYDDFAAVGEDLIAHQYTSPARLGIRGGSNGGLLMGVEFNQRPDLWGAVDIEVPLLDMMRYEQIAAGASWVGEYGSVSVPEERAFLASISPYQNIRAGVHYPLPLVWTTTKDDRVGPQHARKFAARLAELKLPYLYYEVIEGGHGAGATLEEKSAMTAREFTYFARQLSLP